MAVMLANQKKIIRSQTITSAAMNVLMIGIMTFLLQGGRTTLPVWGAKGILFDLLPTTFMSALMAAWIPGLVSARQAQVQAPRPLAFPSVRLPGNALIRATIMALLCVAVLCPLVLLFFFLTEYETVGFWAVLGCKAILGILLGACVTPVAVRQSTARR